MGSGSASKFRSSVGSKWSHKRLWTNIIESWRLKTDPHQSDKLIRIRNREKKRDPDPSRKENRDPGSASKFFDAETKHWHLRITKVSIPDYCILALVVVSVVDPGSEFFPSRIPDPNFSIPRIHITEF